MFFLTFAVLMLSGCQKEEKIDVIHPLDCQIDYDNFESVEKTGDWKSALKEEEIDLVEEIYTSEDGDIHVITANADNYATGKVDTYVVYENSDYVHINAMCIGALVEAYEDCEINGDTDCKELVISFDFMGNGGAGVHETQVWTFENGYPHLVFSSDCDFGYASVLNDNYEIIIDNIYTGDQTRVRYNKDKLTEDFFDENGNPLNPMHAYFDRAYKTVVKDVDNDGDFELVCNSYTHFTSHADYIGDTVTTIDYNKDLRAFVVVGSEFVEPEAE